MKRHFIQTPEFCDQLSRFTKPETLLVEVEQQVLRDLEKKTAARDLIPGTGGFTKLRVPLRLDNRGKRGALRVVYFDCPGVSRTFLMMIYSKASMEKLSDGVKKALKKRAEEYKRWEPKKRKL